MIAVVLRKDFQSFRSQYEDSFSKHFSAEFKGSASHFGSYYIKKKEQAV